MALPAAWVECSTPPKTPAPYSVEFFVERHCLAAESAKGYRRLVAGLERASIPSAGVLPAKRIVIVPAASRLSSQHASCLLNRAASGSLVIFESGAFSESRGKQTNASYVIRAVLGIPARDALPITQEQRAANGQYVEYRWPFKLLVRCFDSITPVNCRSDEVIARFAGIPVCSRHSIGRGTLLFLGSILGVNLFSEEREALEIGAALLSSA